MESFKEQGLKRSNPRPIMCNKDLVAEDRKVIQKCGPAGMMMADGKEIFGEESGSLKDMDQISSSLQPINPMAVQNALAMHEVIKPVDQKDSKAWGRQRDIELSQLSFQRQFYPGYPVNQFPFPRFITETVDSQSEDGSSFDSGSSRINLVNPKMKKSNSRFSFVTLSKIGVKGADRVFNPKPKPTFEKSTDSSRPTNKRGFIVEQETSFTHPAERPFIHGLDTGVAFRASQNPKIPMSSTEATESLDFTYPEMQVNLDLFDNEEPYTLDSAEKGLIFRPGQTAAMPIKGVRFFYERENKTRATKPIITSGERIFDFNIGKIASDQNVILKKSESIDDPNEVNGSFNSPRGSIVDPLLPSSSSRGSNGSETDTLMSPNNEEHDATEIHALFTLEEYCTESNNAENN